jgi:type I restriction enzyme S subunit
VAIAEGPLATNQGFKSFLPPAGLASDYLYYYLQRAKPLALELASGTTFQEVSGKRAAQIPLAIAPKQEQPRIVAKLEELFSDLDAGVAALERARANLKRYRAAVLKAAVEGKLTEQWRKAHPGVEPASKLLERILAERRRKWEEAQLAKSAAAGKAPPKGWKDKYPEPAKADTPNLPKLPEGWCWASIDQLALLVRNGLPEKPSSDPPGFPILRINAVRPMSVDLTEVRYLSKVREKVADYFLTDGDLLFTRYNGSIELLGVCGMVRNCQQETLHPDKLIRVKTALTSPLPEFIEIASNVGFSRKHIQARARTTAGQTGVSGGDIKETPLPLCPLEEQRCIIEEINARLSVINKSMSDMEMGIERATRLRQSILKRAFEGKLVPQDPNDEPASVLLERIRDARAAESTQRAHKRRKASA